MVGERLASLYELEHYYSYEDLLNLTEIVLVARHNEHAAMEWSRKGIK